MADTLRFELVSPERKLASIDASEVQIPGSEGDMTAMPDHAPTITTLRPGILRVVSAEGSQEFAITGGFAEIKADSATILAERAVPVSSLTQEFVDEFMREVADARETATDQQLDVLGKQVSDIAMMATEIGLSLNDG